MERSAHPVILFDGVCNLCDSVVQTIIRHDRHETFHFASLQSQAAQDLLGERAKTIPDSIVLVEPDGSTHLKADAALRIAGRLGGWFQLLRVGWLLPRGVRNLLYDFVARHRYEWFGRRDTCMLPTPALRARFLDRDEPVTVVPDRGSSVDPSPHPEWLKTFLGFTLVSYLWLFLFTFPFGVIPGTEAVAQTIQSGIQGGVQWIASLVAGQEVRAVLNGSGDTTYHWFEFGVRVVIAVITGGISTVAFRGKPVPGRIWDGTTVLVRYGLAAAMLLYGWTKVFLQQFPPVEADRLIQPFGDASPMGLLWTFMGYSPGYQIFGGLAEVFAGILLLWRRTTLLGALVAAAVMTNVVAMNFFFDVPVKIYSTHLLALALFLIAPHLVRLASLLVLNLPIAPVEFRPYAFRSETARRAGQIAKGVVLVIATLMPLQILWMTPPPLVTQKYAGIFVPQTNEGPILRMGISSWGRLAVQGRDGRTVRLRATPVAEAEGFRFEGPDTNLRFLTSESETGRFRVEGTFRDQTVKGEFIRRDEAFELTDRKFNWINERPYNR